MPPDGSPNPVDLWKWMAAHTGMDADRGVLPQLRAATDPAAKGGEFYGPRWGNNGPPVRKPILRPGADAAIEKLWLVSESVSNTSRSCSPPVSWKRRTAPTWSVRIPASMSPLTTAGCQLSWPPKSRRIAHTTLSGASMMVLRVTATNSALKASF